MKKGAVAFIVFLFCVLVIAGGILGWDRTDVQVTGSAFTPNQVQITSGDSVYFKNQTGHGGIVLCLGKKGICASHVSGPADLQEGGAVLDVDKMLPIKFSVPGIYTITSPQHATMTLVITVKRNDNSGYGTGGGGYSGGYGGGGGDE